MDSFDNIWKERLTQSTVPSTDWCTPSEKVWEGVSQEFRKEKRKPVLWWWIGIGILATALVLGSFMIGSTFNKRSAGTIDNTNSAVTKIEGSVESKQELISQEESQKEDAYGSFTSEEELQQSANNLTQGKFTNKQANSIERKNEIEHSQSDTAMRVDKAERSPIEKNISNALVSGPLKIIENQERSSTYEPSFNKEENPELGGAARAKNPFGFSKALPMTQDIYPNSKLTSDLNESTAQQKESPKSKRNAGLTIPNPLASLTNNPLLISPDIASFPALVNPDTKVNNFKSSIWIESGFLFWRHKISDQYLNDLAAFDFEFDDEFGAYLRVGLGRKISKRFEFISGLEFDRIAMNSGHNSTLTYLLDDEGVDQDNLYNLQLATPYGLMDAEFKFVRSAPVSGESVDLLVDFSNQHVIYNVRVPVGMNYKFITNNSGWGSSINIGVGFNYLLHLQNEAISIESNHSAIHAAKESIQLGSQDINRSLFDGFTGISLRKAFSPHWYLEANYEWQLGFSKYFENDSYYTRINRHLAGLRLVKDF